VKTQISKKKTAPCEMGNTYNCWCLYCSATY